MLMSRAGSGKDGFAESLSNYQRQGFNTDDRGFINDEDRINCPFYFKIGSCRNGDRCNRMHSKPTSGQTILIPHMYPMIPDAMAVANDDEWDDETYARAQEHFENFYEEVFGELAKFGEIEDMIVLDNVSEHMLGNVYCKYYREEDAVKAAQDMTNRFYGSRLIQVEFTPVTDFRESRCRAFHETRCARGGQCNFMHVKHVPKSVKRRVIREMYEEHPNYERAKVILSGNPTSKKRKVEVALKQQTDLERRAKIAAWNQAHARGAPLP